MATLPKRMRTLSVPTMEDLESKWLTEVRARLREAWAARDMTAEEIAKATDGFVPPGTWNSWMNATKQQHPTALKLAAAAKALEISLDWLLYGTKRAFCISTVRENVLVQTEDALRSSKREALKILVSHLDELPSPLTLGHAIERDVRYIAEREREALGIRLDMLLKNVSPRLHQEWIGFLKKWKELLLRIETDTRGSVG